MAEDKPILAEKLWECKNKMNLGNVLLSTNSIGWRLSNNPPLLYTSASNPSPFPLCLDLLCASTAIPIFPGNVFLAKPIWNWLNSSGRQSTCACTAAWPCRLPNPNRVGGRLAGLHLANSSGPTLLLAVRWPSKSAIRFGLPPEHSIQFHSIPTAQPPFIAP